MFRTYDFRYGGHPASIEPTKVARFLFDNCAEGARVFYGTTVFIVALSTFFIGYRQICLAHMLQNICKSGDLTAEKEKKRSDKLFLTLFSTMAIYFSIYMVVTLVITKGGYVKETTTLFNVVNAIFTFVGLLLYFYTIMMLRNAINQCASF